jgi:hypothetical protein
MVLMLPSDTICQVCTVVFVVEPNGLNVGGMDSNSAYVL